MVNFHHNMCHFRYKSTCDSTLMSGYLDTHIFHEIEYPILPAEQKQPTVSVFLNVDDASCSTMICGVFVMFAPPSNKINGATF